MRVVRLVLVLVLLAPVRLLAETDPAAGPTPASRNAAKPKTADLSAERQRELERRIEALERQQEMQYREEPAHPTGAPAAE